MTDTENNPASVSIRTHLEPFKESIQPWLVIARNAIPVAGVYGFAWSPNEVLLQIWFAGVSALGAMLLFQMLGFAAREEGPFRTPSLAAQPFKIIFFWLLTLLLFGFPYWFLLLLIVVVNNWTPAVILNSVSGIAFPTLIVMVANIVEEAGHGYDRMTSAEIRHEFNWYFSMHLARLCVIFSLVFLLRSSLIVLLLMLGLSYVEIYPIRALRFFGGDKALDPENKDRSLD